MSHHQYLHKSSQQPTSLVGSLCTLISGIEIPLSILRSLIILISFQNGLYDGTQLVLPLKLGLLGFNLMASPHSWKTDALMIIYPSLSELTSALYLIFSRLCH